MFAPPVQCLALGAQAPYVSQLRGAHFRVFRQCRIDFLHVGRAMKRGRGAANEGHA
jgi:hypothetical protein